MQIFFPCTIWIFIHFIIIVADISFVKFAVGVEIKKFLFRFVEILHEMKELFFFWGSPQDTCKIIIQSNMLNKAISFTSSIWSIKSFSLKTISWKDFGFKCLYNQRLVQNIQIRQILLYWNNSKEKFMLSLTPRRHWLMALLTKLNLRIQKEELKSIWLKNMRHYFFCFLYTQVV